MHPYDPILLREYIDAKLERMNHEQSLEAECEKLRIQNIELLRCIAQLKDRISELEYTS